MNFVTFNINRRERTGRTEVLASPATNAAGLVDSRNSWRFLVIGVGRNHLDGSYRTVLGTVATVHTVC